MEGRGKQPPQSQLPITLIPHLVNIEGVTGDTLPRPRQETVEGSAGNTSPHRGSSPAPRLPPVISSASSYDDIRRSRPYYNYETRSSEPESVRGRGPSVGALGLASPRPMYRHSIGTSILAPTASQDYEVPILSDTSYRLPRMPIPTSSDPSRYAIPSLMPREATPLRSSWEEGEPGPSSLIVPSQRGLAESTASRGRRGSSQPARLRSHPGLIGRGHIFDNEYEGYFGRRSMERDEAGSYWQPPSQHPVHATENQASLYAINFPGSFQDLPSPHLQPEYEAPYQNSYEEHQLYSFPPSGSTRRTWMSDIATGGAVGRDIKTEPIELQLVYGAPEAAPILPPAGSPTVKTEPDKDDGSNESSNVRRRKRRIRNPDERAQTSHEEKKTKGTRKTAVACNFCRGRKLRCNGERPSCFNCTTRMLQCEYVPEPRRRGPGKAPKGSRPKKAQAVASSGQTPETSTQPTGGDHPAGSATGPFDLQNIAPELRPQPSIMNMGTFAFRPPDTTPDYPVIGGITGLIRAGSEGYSSEGESTDDTSALTQSER